MSSGFIIGRTSTVLGQESNPLGSIPGLNSGYGLEKFFPTMKVLLI